LGNLRGRAGGYRRGTLSLAGVSGAIRVARAWDVPLQEIQTALEEFELRWEMAADQAIDLRSDLRSAN
jgi:hypothetical protein